MLGIELHRGFRSGIYTEVTTKNVQALKDALAQLPVSIAIGSDSIYLCSRDAMVCPVVFRRCRAFLVIPRPRSPRRGLRHGRHHGLLEGQESLETHVD